jgi:hypothetical protein
MALLTVQNIVKAGVEPTYAAASTSDTLTDDGTERTFLHYKNTNGATRTVTIAPISTANPPGIGLITIPSMSYVIPATTGDVMIGPFPAAFISSTGIVTATLSASAGVTVAAIKLPRATA